MNEGSFKIPNEISPEPPPSTAVGFLGNNTRDEFPVLKAFQEYIDAEQTKARKRMLGLSIFFVVLISIFTIMFVVVLGWLIQRNQRLEDRIFDMTEKERDRSAEQSRVLAERTEAARRAGVEAATAAVKAAANMPQPQATQSNAAELIKPLLEKLERERAEMRASFEAEKKKLLEENARREKEATKIREAEARKRAAEEKERARQEEIERHRRRLYPEYYSRLEAGHAPSLLVDPTPPSTKATVKTTSVAQPNRTDVTKPAKRKPLESLTPIMYFDDEPAPTSTPEMGPQPKVTSQPIRKVPQPAKKYTTINVKGQGEDVPFIIELPEDK